MKVAWVASAMILARVVLPTPGGPQKIMEPGVVALDFHAQRLAGTEQMLLADVLVEVRGRMRSASGAAHCVGQSFGVERRCSNRSSLARKGHHCTVPTSAASTGEPLVAAMLRRAAHRSDGCVQALHRAGTGNRESAIGLEADLRRHAIALVTDHEGNGDARSRWGAGGTRRVARTLTPASRSSSGILALVGSSGRRKTLPAEARTAFGIPCADRSRQAHHSGCAKGLGRAKNRSQVAGILQAGQRRPPARSFGGAARASQVHSGGSTRAATGCGVSVPMRSPGDPSARAAPRSRQEAEPPAGAPPLRHKDAGYCRPARRASSSRFGPSIPASLPTLPAGMGQRAAQFFQAGILLTLYNADRHLVRTITR